MLQSNTSVIGGGPVLYWSGEIQNKSAFEEIACYQACKMLIPLLCVHTWPMWNGLGYGMKAGGDNIFTLDAIRALPCCCVLLCIYCLDTISFLQKHLFCLWVMARKILNFTNSTGILNLTPHPGIWHQCSLHRVAKHCPGAESNRSLEHGRRVY